MVARRSGGPLVAAVVFFAIAAGCSDARLETPTPGSPEARDGGGSSGGAGGADGGEAGASGGRDGGGASRSNLRLVAANLSSGKSSAYDAGEGIRLLQGLRPDVAFVQELNYESNSEADLEAFVAAVCGAECTYFRESGKQIPNAVVSRYPILTSGQWTDPLVDNRGFAYAKIAVPGPSPLWAVSVHLLTSGAANRDVEARSLVEELGAVVADGDHVVIAGDLNTNTRAEACITTLSQIVVTAGPYPADQSGNDATNAPRNRPYDWVLVDAKLSALAVPTVLGGSVFEAGLVFDSRVYTPLSEVPPVLSTDSDAEGMQHMPVVRDFYLAP